MNSDNKTWYIKGIHCGLPIAVGYFAVSFALGISARSAGFTALQAAVMSLLNNASAGQYAGISLAAAGASYAEVAIMEFIANARYFLMSCSLSQKLSPKMNFLHRFVLAHFITDEFFGLSVTVPNYLNPFFTYGMISVASPAWALGTYLGVVVGNILPANIVSALSVGLFGMFLAIIIPPGRKNHIIAVLVFASMLLSYLCGVLPEISSISSGVRTILLTVIMSLVAAVLFPIKEDAYE